MLPTAHVLTLITLLAWTGISNAADTPAPRPVVERAPISVYVSPTGDDANPGTAAGRPLRTLAVAVDRVQGGDTIIMQPGTHYTRQITISAIPGASAERRLTIRAEPRGLATISQAWPEAAQGTLTWKDEGDGVYSAPQQVLPDGTPVPSSMGGYGPDLLLGWKTVEELRQATCIYNSSHSGKPAGEAFKTPGHGFTIVDGRTYLRLPGRINPNGKRVVIGSSLFPKGDRHPRGEGLLYIADTPGLVIDGLRFEGSYVALAFAESSPQAIVRNCRFEWCHIGVNLPSRSVLEWNEFSYTGLKRLMDGCRELNGSFNGGMIFSFGYQPVWMFGAFVGHVGKPSEVAIRYNYIHEAWDGMWFGGFRNSHCHHNIFQDNIDNAVEFEQAYAPDLHWHHNLVLGAANGVISHQRTDGNLLGPHYIYRNVIVGYDDPGWNTWTMLKMRSKGKSKGFVFHHNLFWMRNGGSLYWRTADNKDWLAALRTVDFRNNILIFDKLTLPEGVPFGADHNVVAGAVGALDKLQGDGGFYRSGIDDLGFADPAAFDFTLRHGSPLINAGGRTPEKFAADIQATVTDGKPDIGPFELGQNMGQEWPRPRRTVFNTAPVGEPAVLVDGQPSELP